MEREFKLVKVQLQIHGTREEDGATVAELVSHPIAVYAAQWPTYARDGFPKHLAELEEQLAAEG
jgi:hypothetical protein